MATSSSMRHLRGAHRSGVLDAEVLASAVRSAILPLGASTPSETTLELQRLVQRVVLEDAVCARFPPPVASHRRLLKQILSVLDSGGVADIDDDLYAACIDGFAAVSSQEDGAFDGHRVFEVSDGCVALRVSSGMGGQLETGARLWSAGLALLGLCGEGALDALLAGHVLELGAGTGVAGLALGRRGGPVSRVTMTDGMPAVVENLRYNAAATEALGATPAPLAVQLLDWADPEAFRPSAPVDAIVGSDLVYDAAAMPQLCRLLRGLLRPAGTARVALLAATQRSDATFQALLAALEAEELCWERVEFPAAALTASGHWLRFADDAPSAMDAIHFLRIVRAAPAT